MKNTPSPFVVKRSHSWKFAACLLGTLAVFSGFSARAASGTWTFTASGTQNWGNAGDWANSMVASGAGFTADFSTVNISGATSVTPEIPRTIGTVLLGDTDSSANYTLVAGSALTFDNNGSGALLEQITGNGSGNALATGLAVVLNDDLTITNSAATAGFLINSGITSTGGTRNLILNADGAGAINLAISGNSVNNVGTITNSGGGTGITTIGASNQAGKIGSNVTSIIQNSAASKLVLSGSNTAFAGTVAVQSGTLQMGNAFALNSNNAVSVASGATFTLGNLNETIGGLNNISGSGGTVTNISLSKILTLAGSGTYSFRGAITGGFVALTVNLTGGGSQTLSGTNTYTGGTTVNAGTLLINGSNAGSAVAVNNAGSVLGGTGTIAPGTSHALTVNSGGVLAPGTSGAANTLTIALNSTGDSATFASGAKFAFELGAPLTNDVLSFTGLTTNVADVTFNNNVVDFTNLGGLAVGNYTLFTFDTNNAYTGTLAIGTGLESFAGSGFTYNANSIVLNVVPEPATCVLTALGLVFVLSRVRRKSSSTAAF